MTFDLSPSESAGSRSLHRLVGSLYEGVCHRERSQEWNRQPIAPLKAVTDADQATFLWPKADTP